MISWKTDLTGNVAWMWYDIEKVSVLISYSPEKGSL
jgi:hypothetical protein